MYFPLNICFIVSISFVLFRVNNCMGGGIREIIHDKVNEVSNKKKGINKKRNEKLMVEFFRALLT